MEVPGLFHVLDVRALWPGSPEAYLDWKKHVPHVQWQRLLAAPGASDAIDIGYEREAFSPSGVVQVCILHLPLFRDCGVNEIWDLREPSTRRTPRPHRCPDRPPMVAGLADGLVALDKTLREEVAAHARTPHAGPPPFMEAIDIAVLTYMAQATDHRGRFLRDVPKAHRYKKKQRDQALATYLGMIEAITYLAHARGKPPRYADHRLALIHALYDVVARYGPQRGFGIQARCAVLHVLLEGVKLEKPAPTIISGANRLQGLMDRHDPAP